MPGKDLEYRLVIKDDGTPVLKKVAVQVDQLAQKTKTLSTGQKVPLDWGNEKQFSAVNRQVKEITSGMDNLDKVMGRIQRTVVAFVAVWAFREVISGFEKLVSIGVEYNSMMEDAKLGISSILTAQGTFVDVNNAALDGVQALNAAYQEADRITKQLQLDNLQTKATFEQLVKAYQQTLAPALGEGFNLEQVRKYTVSMVQAASALGLNLDMLAEETRSMLRGAITPRNTLIATALGIRNEDIAKYKGDVDGLYNFIMGRLKAFSVAGIESQKTFSGMLSNMKDAISMVLGRGFEGLFDNLKKQMDSITKYFVTFTSEGPVLNEDIVAIVRDVSSAIVAIINAAKETWDWISKWEPVFSVIYELLRLIYLAFKPILMLISIIGMSMNSWLGLIFGIHKGNANIIKDFNDWTQGITKTTEALEKMKKAVPNRVYAGHGPDTARYVPREVGLTKEQEDEVAKLRSDIGVIGEEEERRIGNLNSIVPIYQNINDLNEEQLKKIAAIGREMEKSNLPLKYRELYAQKAAHELDVMKVAQYSALEGINLQISEQNKNYEEQIRLIGDLSAAEILRLTLEGKMTDQLAAAMRRLTEAKKTAVGRTATTEKIGYEEEILKSQLTVAKLKGDIDTQVNLESKLVDKTIERRIVNQDLRGELGKQAAESIKQANSQEGIVRKEAVRLDYLSRISNLQEQVSSHVGDYNIQAQAILDINKYQIASLTNEGKLVGVQGQRIKNLMTTIAQYTAEDTILKGEIALQKNLLDQQIRIAQASGDTLEVYRLQYQVLSLELGLLEKQLERVTDPKIKNSIQEWINLQKSAGIEEEVRGTESVRLDYLNRLSSAQAQLAGMTGDYKIQADVILDINNFQVQQLDNEGKLKGAVGDRIKSLMNLTALYASQDVELIGQANLTKRILEQQLNIVTANADINEMYRLQRNALEIDLGLMEKTLDRIKDPEIKKAVQDLINLTREAGITRESVSRQEDFLSATEKFSSLQKSIADMTGNVEAYEAAVKSATEAEIQRIKLDPKLKEYAAALEILIKDYERLNVLVRFYNRAQQEAKYKAEIATQLGDYGGLKDIEMELLTIEKERLMNVGGLSAAAKEYLQMSYSLKMRELDAEKNLRISTLMDIGLKKEALKVSQEVADTYKNLIPNSIDITLNSFRQLFDDLDENVMGSEAAFDKFMRTLSKGFRDLLMDIALLIIKMEILNALGYGQGTGSGGAPWWATLIKFGASTASSIFGGGGANVNVPVGTSTAGTYGWGGLEQGFHQGGFIKDAFHDGGLSNNEVIIKALKDEYVIRPSSVKSIGKDKLDYINETGRLPSNRVSNVVNNAKSFVNLSTLHNGGIVQHLFEQQIRNGDSYLNPYLMEKQGQFRQSEYGIEHRTDKVNNVTSIKNIENDYLLKPIASRDTGRQSLNYMQPTGKVPNSEFTINVPVNVEGNKKLASELQSQIEKTVIRVMRESL